MSCPLCESEIKKMSDRRIYQDPYVTIIENIRPYYPTKLMLEKQTQYLIISNEHCQYENLSIESKQAIYAAKKLILQQGGAAYICGNNTGNSSGASVPDHYHLHMAIIHDECTICSNIGDSSCIIREYPTVVILKDNSKTSSRFRCYIITTKRHNANPINYTQEEIDDLITAETEFRIMFDEAGKKNLNTMENYGAQSYFDSQAVTIDEVVGCEHPCTRFVTRGDNNGGGIGFGSVTNVKYFAYYDAKEEDQIISEFKKQKTN
jgi:diadenosine tetraphosphate (Ap4A) HIT family hydrolase